MIQLLSQSANLPMQAHSFPCVPRVSRYHRADALAMLRSQAISQTVTHDFGIVVNELGSASGWCTFDVHDGALSSHQWHITPHRAYERLEPAIAYLNFLCNFMNVRVGVMRQGREWLVFRINEQQHQQQPLI